MKDKFYMVFVEGENTPTVQYDNLKEAEKEAQRLAEKYDNLKEAEKEAQRLAEKYGKKVFVLESASLVTPDEINVKVDTFGKALEYLGYKKLVYLYGIPDKHAKAMVAMYKLITIAEAWNKADNFVPDFSNRNQYKYFPWLVYNDNAAGFVFTRTNSTALTAYAYIGSRLCFSTSKRAEQFGKQFIDLWNDFLLFN